MATLKQKLPPLTATVTFEAAARHLSFTAAANELNVTQAAVSRQIRHLEQHFGKPLFERAAGGLRLTAAGETFFRDIDQPLTRLAGTAQKLRRQVQANEIVVTSTLGYAEHWLTPKLAGFHRLYPDIRVRLLATDSDISRIEYVVDGMFSIGYGDNVDTRNAIVLCEEQVYPVCSPGYLQGSKPINGPADLPGASLISITADHWVNIGDEPTTWQSWFESCGMRVDTVDSTLAFNNDAFAVQAALSGQGITLGWDHLVRDYINSGQLLRLTDHVYVSGRKFYLFKTYTHGTPALDNFENWVKSMYATDDAGDL